MKVKNILLIIHVFTLIFFINGCGSGSGSDSGTVTTPITPTVTNEDPTGVWEGTYTENGVGTFDIVGIVNDDKVIFISDTGSLVYVGTVSVSGANFTATPTNYTNIGTSFETTSLSGTVSTKSMISGVLNSSSGEIGNYSLKYSVVTDKGSSLAITDGNWMRSNTNYTAVVSVDSTGLFTGSDTIDCVYIGSISIIDPIVNIYGLSFTASSCSVSIFNGAFIGYVIITDTVTTNDTLIYFGDNPDNMILGTLTRT